jgi:hypothetical protein
MFGWTNLIYMFVVNPVTSNLIKKNPGRRGIIYAILALLVFASFTTYTGYIAEKEESFYSLLEVPVFTPQTEIKRAYRKVSLKYHPDKQMDLDDVAKEAAATRYAKIQEASEVLQDSRARKIYDRFGAKAVKSYQTRSDDSDPTSNALMGLGINFVIWGMLTFLLTLGDGGANARMYSFVGLVIITMAGWQLMLDDFDFLQSSMWFWTPYDKAQILQHLYPAYMRGSTIIAQAQYVDKEKVLNEKIQWMVVALQKLHQKVDMLQGRRSKAPALSAAAAATDDRTDGGNAGVVDPVKKAKLKALAAANKKSGSNNNSIQQQQQQQQKGGIDGPQTTKPRTLGIPSWAWGIGIYIFIQWVFSS